MHLGLHDIHGARARVFEFAIASQVVERTKGREQTIHEPFGDFLACGVENRGVGHEMANVAHKQQAAAGQGERAPIHSGEPAIRVQAPSQRVAAFFEGVSEIALHQTQPVAIDHDLVLGIHRGNRVLAILDRGQRGFEADVFDARGIGRAHSVVAVNLNLDMQAVVTKQDTFWRIGVTGVTNELGGVCQRCGLA